jgi:hypothetical protein
MNGHASTECLQILFNDVKARVLASRVAFIEMEHDHLNRGVENWPLHLQSDMFASYASLSFVTRIVEEIGGFAQPDRVVFSFFPLLQTLKGLVVCWAPSSSWKANVSRLINCCVVSISVLIAAIFVLIPDAAELFPSGSSSVIIIVFIFQSSGFGSSLKNSRERLVRASQLLFVLD